MEWEERRFFAYMVVSAYHVISMEVENSPSDTIEFLDTHVCINNPHWQSSGTIVFLCKYYIVISNTLIGWRVLFVARCNIIRASWETKKERLTYRKKVHRRRICVRNITFLAAYPSFYVIFAAFFVYSLPFPKWRTCWMAPIETHDIAMGSILCDDIMSER